MAVAFFQKFTEKMSNERAAVVSTVVKCLVVNELTD